MKKEKYWLTIPANIIKDSSGGVVLVSEKKYFQAIASQGKTEKEAEKEFWILFEGMWKYHLERSKELNLWKPFQKGPWGEIGGDWLTMFGIHISFRYGKPMKYGWYIPFTKLNISIRNFWRTA